MRGRKAVFFPRVSDEVLEPTEFAALKLITSLAALLGHAAVELTDPVPV